MNQQLIPADLLRKSDKILFIAHLALGDFTYLQNCFQAFAKAYPHIRIHLWIDEVRRTSNAAQWPFLKAYSLYDWAQSCPFFTKVYRETYSPALYQSSINTARNEHYPIVVSLGTLRPQQYARLARTISPEGFVVGMRRPTRLLQLHHLLDYRKLSASIPAYHHQDKEPFHITDEYAHWFKSVAGVNIPREQRLPFVDIPPEWQQYAQEQFIRWGFNDKTGAKVVFINAYAKTKKRCWPLEHVAALIRKMQQDTRWQDACFIVNAVPQELPHARSVIEQHGLARTVLFSAEDNFFQLPAILAQCQLIISVETAVMHLANAVHVPVIALMRQKNPEWVPIDRDNSIVIHNQHRREWVRDITVEKVFATVQRCTPIPSHPHIN